MSAEVAAVLRAAAQAITDRGWCQGTRVDADGRVCIFAAVETAICGSPYTSMSDAQWRLRNQTGERYTELTAAWRELVLARREVAA